MRVTNASVYRNYTTSMNNVQARLNKSFNKVSSGKAYESAAENPLAYYKGQKIDSQYQKVLGQKQLLTTVKNRLEQQEDGAYDIQKTLSEAKNDVINKALTGTPSETAMATLRDHLLQLEHNIVNDLQAQYQDFYVYGGNDSSTPPFSLSADGMTLTYSHKFPGDAQATDFVMKLNDNGKFELDPSSTGTEAQLIQAMSEQGFLDLGYGDIRDRDTLLDTFTGGMNLLTGITSGAVKTGNANGTLDLDTILDALSEGPLGLTARGVQAMDKYLDPNGPDYGDRAKLNSTLSPILQKMTESEHKTSTVYSDLGNKYQLIENLETKLKNSLDSLNVQYKDTVGADPYESIYEMFNNQYSYNAALQVGSNLMSSSLFDFIR